MEARVEAFWRAHMADPAEAGATPVKDIVYFFTWLDDEEWDINDPDWDAGCFETLSHILRFQAVRF
jgi:hypothetical protein